MASPQTRLNKAYEALLQATSERNEALIVFALDELVNADQRDASLSQQKAELAGAALRDAGYETDVVNSCSDKTIEQMGNEIEAGKPSFSAHEVAAILISKSIEYLEQGKMPFEPFVTRSADLYRYRIGLPQQPPLVSTFDKVASLVRSVVDRLHLPSLKSRLS